MKKIIITLLIASSVLAACAQEYKIYSPTRIYGYLAINPVTALPANPTYFTMVTYRDTLRIYGASGWAALYPKSLSGSGSVTSINISTGSTGLTALGGPITSSGTITIGGTLSPGSGGTGIYSYTEGDMLYAAGATSLSKLSAVAIGNVLVSAGVGTVPIWSKVSLTSHVNGVLPVANGGTGTTTGIVATKGDVKVNGTTTANTIAFWNGTDSTLVSNDVIKPYEDSLVITKELYLKDSLRLHYIDTEGLPAGSIWLTNSAGQAIDSANTEPAYIGWEMEDLPTLEEYEKDVKMINGHMERRVWYIDYETKELKSQYGWDGLGMMNTQSAYMIYHEITVRWMFEQNKKIAELQKVQIPADVTNILLALNGLKYAIFVLFGLFIFLIAFSIIINRK